jgi:hypothetical protein
MSERSGSPAADLTPILPIAGPIGRPPETDPT